MENYMNLPEIQGRTNGVRVAGTAIVLAGLLIITEMCSVSKMEYIAPAEKNSKISASADVTGKSKDTMEFVPDVSVPAAGEAESGNVSDIAEKEFVVSAIDIDNAGNIGMDSILPDIGSAIIMPGTDYVENPGKDVIIPDIENMENPGKDVIIPDIEDVEKTEDDVIVPDEETAGDMEEDVMVPGDDITTEEQVPDEETGEEQIPATLNGFLIDAEGLIYGVDMAVLSVTDGYLELPSEECVGLRSGALAEIGAGIAEIYIPSNVSVIEEGALAGLSGLEWIEAAEGNPGCVSIDGVLFDGSGTTLLSFPGGRTDMYVMPENVMRIASGAFAGSNVFYIDFWQCGLVEIGANVFGESDGSGIEIRVPEENMQWYQDAFAGYNVEIM